VAPLLAQVLLPVHLQAPEHGQEAALIFSKC
jgi:hypothetical protein